MNEIPENQPAEATEPTEVAEAAEPTPKTRWRHRRLALPVVAGIALGGLAIGAGGAVVVDHVTGHDRPGHVQREGFPPGGHDHRGGMMAPPGGQLPPGVAPDQDSDTDTESDADSSSSGEAG